MAEYVPEGAPTATAPVAVIGGSGFYQLIDDATEVEVDTPWGAPSAPITIGQIADRTVAFLPRHGTTHHLSPHAVPYRANLWALRELGARRGSRPVRRGRCSPTSPRATSWSATSWWTAPRAGTTPTSPARS